MTKDSFNDKWKNYLQEGQSGLEINDPAVIEYLDKVFEGIIKEIPQFKYSSIKLKNGKARFYSTCPPEYNLRIENGINIRRAK